MVDDFVVNTGFAIRSNNSSHKKIIPLIALLNCSFKILAYHLQ